jgi:Na+-driven multidrug efflux pump
MNLLPTFDFSYANVSRGAQDIQMWSLNDSGILSTKSRGTIPMQNLNMSAWSIEWNEPDNEAYYDENNIPISPMSP